MLISKRTATVYNLDESLPQSIRSLSTTIFEYFSDSESSNRMKQSFLGGNDSVHVPGFGGTKIPWLLELQQSGDERRGVAVIVSEELRSGVKELLCCLKIESTENIVELQLSTFFELESSINDYINRYKSMPRLVVVDKSNDSLNYAEQLLIDMCISHGIRIVFSNDVLDLTFEFDSPECDEIKREMYSNYFFPHWKSAEGLIRDSVHTRSTLVQSVESIPSLVTLALN